MTHQEILHKLDLLLEKEYQLALTTYQVGLESKALLQRVYHLDNADRTISKAYLRLAQASMKNLPCEALEAHFKPKADRLKQDIEKSRQKAIKTLDKGPLKKLLKENFSKEKKLFEQIVLLFLPDPKTKEAFLKAFEAQDNAAFEKLLKKL